MHGGGRGETEAGSFPLVVYSGEQGAKDNVDDGANAQCAGLRRSTATKRSLRCNERRARTDSSVGWGRTKNTEDASTK